jgi:hypothetical protein
MLYLNRQGYFNTMDLTKWQTQQKNAQ